jgi:cytochrome b pre-mRNA-processing protein 3
MNLWPWRKPSPKPEDRLYAAIVAATRRPRFYAEWGVPDTFDGRFDMLVAHLYLVVERLKDESQDELGRALIERFITDMDDVLRELGTSDVTVGKKVRKMAEAFHGRAAAYDRADADETALAAALARNLWPEAAETPAAAAILAHWLITARAALAAQPVRAITEGEVTFP